LKYKYEVQIKKKIKLNKINILNIIINILKYLASEKREEGKRIFT